MSLYRPAALILLLTLLSGCSTIEGWFSLDDEEGNTPAELVDIDASVRIKKLWSTGVGSGQGEAYHHLRPLIIDDLIYAAGNDGTLVALDRLSGKRAWRQELDRPLSGGVGRSGDSLLLGTSDGDVISLALSDGSERWSVNVRGEVMAPPAGNGRVVVVQTYDGKLRGLAQEDGAELWVYDSNVPVLTLRGTSAPIAWERLAIAAFGNGKVMALDINTGAVRWESRVAIAQGRSEIDRIVDIDGSMLQVGTTLYAVSYQGRLAAIDMSTGRKVWQEEVSSYVGLDQGFGNVYVAEDAGTVTAFLRNGQGIRWQQPALSYRRLSAPRVIKGYVAVGDLDGYVHLLAQVDGEFVGRTQVDGDGVRADMLAVDDVLYVFGNSGTLAALRVTPRDK